MMDTARLILEVEKRTCLWNSEDPGYGVKQAKRQAWEEITQIIFPGYENLPYVEKHNRINDVQKKWRNVRDYYVKERKYQQGKTNHSFARKRKYVFFDLLSFLDTPTELRSAYKSYSKDDPRMYLKYDNCLQLSLDEKNYVNVKEEILSNYGEEEEEDVEDLMSSEAEPGRVASVSDTESVLPAKRSRSSRTEESEDRDREEVDEDKTFLMSLVPGMRRLSDLQRMDFKVEVLNTLRRITFQGAAGQESSQPGVSPGMQRATAGRRVTPSPSPSSTHQSL